ncbi:DUF1592 domain-containing protein [Humisphaera borealis]|uniref:DUF1592 domain-containing protein n=1 Tax=Humisphaera borealis TaxID=2807512 RepID=A0A7M2WQ03_9BACT|nr:DUF1592 domain-containing protein [Humisphaera borealis]QOV87605.1 DUF1592 domain-containing protein [Humisphaera borealis]
MPRTCGVRLILSIPGLLCVWPTWAAEGVAVSFEEKIRPLLTERCITCHSTEKQKGELDLERFVSIADARKEPAIWQNVLDQIASGEMPPRKEPQLLAEQKTLLITWAKGTLDQIALANAGDPGPVAIRRLSNVEYTNTLRDLTGIDALDPAREFPADGAAGEGFTNASAALVMSPALVSKYLDAAKEIAGHAVLLPDGIRFSARTTPRDWTDESLGQIRAFYSRFSGTGNATAVNLQGVKFDTNAGGRLPVEQYVAALLHERESLRAGQKTVADVSKGHSLNPKYTAILWAALNDTKPSLVLEGVRTRFRDAPANDASAVVSAISAWQQSLWRFSSIGHIGKVNGPKGWQEAVSPVAAQHELRLKLTPPKDRGDEKVYLSITQVFHDGPKGSVLWDQLRLVTKGGKDLLLRDIPGVLPSAVLVQSVPLIELSIPAAAIKETELVATVKLAGDCDPEAAIQVQMLAAKPAEVPGLSASNARSGNAPGQWSDNNLRTSHSAPILAHDASAAAKRLAAAFDDFRRVFPVALCYTKIVPVDEVVTLTLFYREDDQLRRLMLDDEQSAALDRMWSELRFVSESPLKQVDAFDQLWQFATQDAKPEAFEPMREPIRREAEAFRKLAIEVEPRHVQAVIDFADRAWRRPLAVVEQDELRSLYRKLRDQTLPHPTAVRLLIARVLVAPAFLYKAEKTNPGVTATPVSDEELASRLSYFLWSSCPDDELRRVAASGRLHEPEILVRQTRRMLKDAKVRRLATEFGCQWLGIRDLDTLNEKSERHFPTFLALRGAMQEEAIRYFADLFQEDRSVVSLIDADHSFMNGDLARHYGLIPATNDWRRIDGIRARGRGGVLGFAGTLARQAGASRTSPILRGNWVSEVLLGEKLPRPPKGVPVLPEEAPNGLTERQLIERHSSDASCAKCHQRIDPFGFALEGFDAIGRARTKDAADLPIDTHTRLPNGRELDGLSGLRNYILTERRDDFLRQFARKLLGYALGRSVQLSDQPLLDTMLVDLKSKDDKVGVVVERIVLSRQFREIRGRDLATGN